MSRVTQLTLVFAAWRATHVRISTVRNSLSAILHVRGRLGDSLPLIPKKVRSMFFKGLEWLIAPDTTQINPMLPHHSVHMNKWLMKRGSKWRKTTTQSIIVANILGSVYGLRPGEMLESSFDQDPLKILKWKNISMTRWQRCRKRRDLKPLSRSDWNGVISDLQGTKAITLKLFMPKHFKGRPSLYINLFSPPPQHQELDVIKELINLARYYRDDGQAFSWEAPLLRDGELNGKIKSLSASRLNIITKCFCQAYHIPMFRPHDRRRGMATAANTLAFQSDYNQYFTEAQVSVALRHSPSTTRLYMLDTKSVRREFVLALIKGSLEVLPGVDDLVLSQNAPTTLSLERKIFTPPLVKPRSPEEKEKGPMTMGPRKFNPGPSSLSLLPDREPSPSPALAQPAIALDLTLTVPFKPSGRSQRKRKPNPRFNGYELYGHALSAQIQVDRISR